MERFKDFASDSLNGAINNSQTTLVVNDGTLFPTTGTFRIRVDSELMKVTGVSSNTFTIVRAQGGTTAASHANGAIVDEVVTSDFLDAFRQDSVSTGTYASMTAASTLGRAYFPDNAPYMFFDNSSYMLGIGPLYPVKVPDNTLFSWSNQHLATVTVSNGMIYLEDPEVNNSSGYKIRYKNMPTPPFKVNVGLFNLRYGENYSCVTVGFFESSSSKGVQIQWSSVGGFDIVRLDTGASVLTINAGRSAPFVRHVQLQHDGTNIYINYSNDGLWFKNMWSAASGTYMNTGPDKLFISAWAALSAHKAGITVWNWDEAPP
jgi:hypothetical protein